MSTKQISKDNKEYWENKLNTKYNTKIKAIESMHLAEIRENTEKNFGSFTKMLRVETDLKAVEKAEKDFAKKGIVASKTALTGPKWP